MRRGQRGNEKEWTDCVQSDIRAFGLTGDWKATALEVEVWVETVAECARRFIAAWRKEEVDAARHRQEKREAARVVVVVAFTLKTVLTSIQYPSLSYSSRERNEFPWSQANSK